MSNFFLVAVKCMAIIVIALGLIPVFAYVVTYMIVGAIHESRKHSSRKEGK